MSGIDDLYLINGLNAALIVVVVGFPHSHLRLPLALALVLLFPGYTLVAALYPRRDDLGVMERVALSLGASLAVVALLGLLLNFLPWGLRLESVLVSLAGLTLAYSLLAAWARRRLPRSERFGIEITTLSIGLRTLPWGQTAFIAVVIISTVIIGWHQRPASSRTAETFTEFYLLGPSGKAVGYPEQVTAGGSAEVILGIINHEGRRTAYKITVSNDTQLLKTLGPLTLDDTRVWKQAVRFSLTRPSAYASIDFALWRNNDPQPYRHLRLWVRVVPG